MVHRFWRVIAKTVGDFFSGNGMFLAAGLSYYVLLYCFPLLLLFVTALGYTLESSERALAEVQSIISELIPTSQRAIAGTLESLAERRGLLGLMAVGTFLIFGTVLFGAVRHVLNSVFGVEQPRSFLRAFGADIVVMLGTGGLLALTVGLASVMALVLELAGRLPFLEPYLREWTFTGRILGFVFTWALLILLYRVAPARKLGWRALVIASLAGALLLEASKWAFGWYVQAAAEYTVLYGALSGLIFFVLWIYYASTVFVLAATLGRIVDQERSG